MARTTGNGHGNGVEVAAAADAKMTADGILAEPPSPSRTIRRSSFATSS